MSKLFIIQLIRHKYDLISFEYVGSSLLSYLSPFYRQFDLWVRYRGESISRQDHFIFYKWFYFEFIAPIPTQIHRIEAPSPHLGSFLRLSGQRAG